MKFEPRKFLITFRDNDPRVRSKAVLSLAQVLGKVDCENVSRKECELFSDFMLRDLSHLAHDSFFFVKRSYARVIGDIGEIAYRFARRCIEGNDQIRAPRIRIWIISLNSDGFKLFENFDLDKVRTIFT